MARHLMAIYPQNIVESIVMPNHKKSRYTNVYNVTHDDEHSKGLKRTETKKSPAPHGLKFFAGSAYIIVSREFVEWIVKNETAQQGCPGPRVLLPLFSLLAGSYHIVNQFSNVCQNLIFCYKTEHF